ncbi:MAG: hypothetical protein ACI4TK_17880 [Agathobacter sp.]
MLWCTFSLEQLMHIVPEHISIEQKYQYYPFSDEWKIVELDEPQKVEGFFTLMHCDGWWIANYEDGFLGKSPQDKNAIEAIIKLIELLYANGYKFPRML